MIIYVSAGFGEGKTTLSAFDSALGKAGISNFNLIYLSSVIPPKSKIVLGQKSHLKNGFGKMLYVVIAEKRSDEVGNYLGAGLGWYVFKNGSGVFVEHVAETKSKKITKERLEKDITNSLQDLCAFRKQKFESSKVKYLTIIKKITSKPVSVLVVASYKIKGWK